MKERIILLDKKKQITNNDIKTLIQNSQNHDEDSFNKLFEAFMPLRHRLTRDFVSRNKSIPYEDIVSEVDYAFWLSVMNYDETKDNSPKRHLWNRCRGIMMNFATVYNNKMGPNPPLLFGNEEQLENILHSTGTPDSLEFEEQSLDSIEINDAINKLDINDHYFIDEYYLKDKRQEDISKDVGKHVSNVNRSIFSAKRALKQLLDQ